MILFAVFLAVQGRSALKDAWRTPGGRGVALAIGAIGMTATLLAIACTQVPSPDAGNPVSDTLKLVFASAVLILFGIAFYGVARWRADAPCPCP